MISVGIDIGSSSIKIAEAEASGRSVRVIRLEEFPFSPDPGKDKKIEIVDILRQLSRRYDPSSTRFVMAVSQHKTSFRRLMFPFKERHKILKSIAFELEDEIPFLLDEAIFEAKISRYVGASADILAIACPQDHIAEVIQTANDGSIDASVISVEGAALANLFEPWRESPIEVPAEENPPPGPFPAEVILSMGHQNTILLVIRDGYLLDVRNIDWGGRDLATTIANKYSMHYLEALRELQSKSFVLTSNEGATQNQVTYSDTIKSSLKQFGHEARLTLMELQTEYNLSFDKVHMVGGISRLKNLGPYLTQLLEIPTNRVKNLSAHPHLGYDKDTDQFTVGATAIGLAMEGLRRPKNPPVNLRKNEFARKSQTFQRQWEKWNYTAKVVAAGFAILLVYSIAREQFAQSMADQAYTQMVQQAQQVANLKLTQATPRNIRKFIAERKRLERNRELADELQTINSALDVLNRISSAAPSKRVANINVKKVSVNNDVVEIQGEVDRAQAVKAIETALKSVAENGNVKTLRPQIRSSQGYQPFAFSFRVNRRGGRS